MDSGSLTGYITNSEPIRKERETCFLPASLAQQQLTIPSDLETSTDLNKFSQIYKEDLEIPSNEQEPLLVLS